MITKNFVIDKESKWYYEYYQDEQFTENLILLHEGLGSVAQWKQFPQVLHHLLQMNVLVFDRTGYGQSSAAPENYPKDYLRYEAQVVFPKILESLKIDQAHLLGHSDGGTIALLAASFFPDKIKSVISIAAHVIIEDISTNGISEIRKKYQQLKRSLSRYHGDKTDWVFFHWADTWLEADFKKWQMIEELQRIKAPVFAMQGEQDEYGSYEQLQIIKDHSNAQILFIENCGHQPHVEKTGLIVQKAEEFLKSLL